MDLMWDMRELKESRFLKSCITRGMVFSVIEMGKTEGGWLERVANIRAQF